MKYIGISDISWKNELRSYDDLILLLTIKSFDGKTVKTFHNREIDSVINNEIYLLKVKDAIEKSSNKYEVYDENFKEIKRPVGVVLLDYLDEIDGQLLFLTNKGIYRLRKI